MTPEYYCRSDASYDLIPCPFCGESELIKPTVLPATQGPPYGAITCLACGAVGPIDKNGLEANRKWNKRS